MRKNQTLACLAFSLYLCSFTATAQDQKEDSLYQKSLADTLAKYPPLVAATTNNSEDQKIFEAIEIEASVNVAKWRRQLEKNLQAPVENAAKKGMKAGYYTVLVRFLVEKDGSISDVKALNDPGYGIAEASVKVVATGPRWTPGEHNGRKVRSYHTQPITFVISGK
jgi:periplasmic protein TonB